MAEPTRDKRPDDGQDLQVYLASERTLLSWIRTGLAMVGFGFVVARFGIFLQEASIIQGFELKHPPVLSVWLGTAMAATGVIVVFMAGVQHANTVRRLRRGEPIQIPTKSPSFLLSLVLGLIGVALVVYLVVVSLNP